jgi:hypothetical protein
MQKEIKLLELYGAVCRYYDTVPAAKAQANQRFARMSNNDRPLFTDSECITACLFGISEGMFSVKSAYGFVRDYIPG